MLQVEVITPERIVKSLTGDEVVIPTTAGVVGIRTGHIPLIAPLQAGEVVVKHGTERDHFAVAGGFVEVINNTVRLLADSAEHAEELDELEVAEAVKRAQQAKADASDRVQFAEATALIELNMARLKVAKRKKAHGSSSLRSPRD